MTKFEFLGDLSRLIADLPEEDQEQAMEYYEDYFADAGPEREQEIIKQFISPAYIAEQLREASAQRLAEENAGAFVPPKVTEKPAVFSRKSAAQAAQSAQQTPVAQAQPAPATPNEQNAEDKEKQAYESLAMRNPIFQQRTAESVKKEEEELALKQKTKVDVKSINKTTANINKKDKKAAKQRAAEEKAFNASLYSGPKKTLIIVVLIITSPITLCLAGVILGLFAVAIGLVIGLVALGIISILGSLVFLALALLALLTVKMPNAIFALGFALLLFAVGCGICFVDYKLFTRTIPGAFYGVQAQVGSIKAKLSRLAMK